MPTIVQYTKDQPPHNLYPWSIVSPPAASACCFTDMQIIGDTQHQGLWSYAYSRCRSCGFTVQLILRAAPDPMVVSDLQRTFERLFRRKKDAL